MQAMLDISVASVPGISQADAQQIVRRYVATAIDPVFEVVSDIHAHRAPNSQAIWRFFVRCEDGPLYTIEVDIATGKVFALTSDEIRVIREKATIYAARKQGILPVDERGYVLAEYARRQADSYIGNQIAMFFNAIDPVFVPGDPPRWQVTIVFKMIDIGPITLGTLDVNAQTGEPIMLTVEQIQKIKERARVIVEFQTQTATAPL
ncbi:MAG: hypothetical protein U0350_02895 [Caldilineaceae bacterium]